MGGGPGGAGGPGGRSLSLEVSYSRVPRMGNARGTLKEACTRFPPLLRGVREDRGGLPVLAGGSGGRSLRPGRVVSPLVMGGAATTFQEVLPWVGRCPRVPAKILPGVTP